MVPAGRGRDRGDRMSNRRTNPLDDLEARLTRPLKVALFGHRNVGKTTLLAMFYRQASSGQVPGLRLAAADARTAEYLAEKIAQIESGQPMAGSVEPSGSRQRNTASQSAKNSWIGSSEPRVTCSPW